MNDILIYIKCDENNNVIEIKSNLFLSNIDEWIKIDEWTDGEDRYLYAHADNEEYMIKKFGKPLLDENKNYNFKYQNGEIIELNENEKIDIEKVRELKNNEMSIECNNIIVNGIDVELADKKKKHFSLTTEDQINLFGKQVQLASGLEQFEYHADGEICVYYSKEDMTKIVQTAMNFVSYHTTYYNSLKNWINSLNDKEQIDLIKYGDNIPEEYQSEVLKDYIILMGV